MFKNKLGVASLPIAIILMIFTGIVIMNLSSVFFDKSSGTNDDNTSMLARREADNALLYGIWASNTPASDHGHKCSWGKHLQSEYEVTNEDGGLINIDGKIIKRFVTFSGTTDDGDAILTGISRVYDNKNTLIAEKAVSIHLNLLYTGRVGERATSSCDATMIEIKKNTYKEIKKALPPVYIPPEQTETKTGPNLDKCAPLIGTVSGCSSTIYKKVSCQGDALSLICTFTDNGYIQIHNGKVNQTNTTPSGAKSYGSSVDIITALNGNKTTSQNIIAVKKGDVLRMENAGENFKLSDESLVWDKSLDSKKDYDIHNRVKYSTSYSRDYGWVKYIHSY